MAYSQNRADAPVNPFANDPAAAAQGKAVFDGVCITCHGPGGTGGRGPALNTGQFQSGPEDADLFRTIHDGIAGTGMPAFQAMSANDIWHVVSYLRSLSGGGAAADVAGSPDDAARGEALFFGAAGCSGCHEVDGRGSILAADLSEEGVNPADKIRAGLMHNAAPPRFFGGSTGNRVDLTLADGRKVTGVLRAEDAFSIDVTTLDGQLMMLDRKSLKSLEVGTGPYRPTDIATRLKPAEIDDIVAYLSRQKERDVKGSIPVSAGPTILPGARIVKAADEPQNWLTYWGSYNGHHFSRLRQIDAANAKNLQARWAAQLPGNSQVQATPIVVDGVMYVSGPPGDVYAFDARTGLQLWKFSRKQDVVNPYQINPANRGVAVANGRVFFNTLDDNLIALDARSGRELWERRLADTMQGYEMTGAPLAVGNKVFVGVGGGEYGLRGFLEAYDQASGNRLWHFDTIPGPGQPGHDTWLGDSWKTGGGGTWLTGSYDPETNTLYWGVGNPAPSANPDIRKGDDLYTDSVVAIDADSGTLKWHYQFTPNDSHDWDSAEDMVLADRVVDGKKRKVLIHADRNGMVYILDRLTGQFLSGKAFVRQTWNDGFGADGRPRIRPDSVATPQGHIVFPAVGGTNFQAPSYDERSGILYLAFQDSQGFASYSPQAVNEPGRSYTAQNRGAKRPAAASPPMQGIRAVDPSTGKAIWTFALTRGSLQAGVLGTAGNVVFAATAEGSLIALDMRSGKALWWFKTGVPSGSSPMSYAINGVQYVAFAAGNSLYSFALPQGAAK